jgi:two-component system, NarL family, response regulator NreC
MNTIKIVIADDHRLFREGVKLLLSQTEDMEIIGEVTDGAELVALLTHTFADVVLADITMPKLSGIDAIAEIRKHNRSVKFILLSMHEEGEYILKAVQMGASGYLFKNTDTEELEKAIRAVATGGRYFNSTVSAAMMDNLSKTAPEEESEPLTKREIEVLEQVAQGHSTKLIADHLCISPRTVDTHRTNLMKKIGAVNTAELIRKALEKKLIS